MVQVPEMAESISEGTLKQFSKSTGDYVEQDEEIATIETDKIDVAVNAPEAGTIKEILVKEEDTVAVGQEIVKLDAGAAPPEGGEGGKKEESKPADKEQKQENPSKQEKAPPSEEQQRSSRSQAPTESKPTTPKQERKPPPSPPPPKKQEQKSQGEPRQPEPKAPDGESRIRDERRVR